MDRNVFRNMVETLREVVGDSNHSLTIRNAAATLQVQLREFMTLVLSDESGDEGPDESMDGDATSALASAGFGTDEDYGYFGDGEEVPDND